ncbi:MAG: response regulator transcription factor [Roseivirga sp.]|nr:response regulator transcription factor [Roseivirga sp.]
MIEQYSAIIVDDETNNRENLQHLLVKHCPGIEITGQAASVAEAIHLIKTTSPEVVFLDIEMPGGNGFSLLEKLQPIDFQVIFVTAFDSYALNAIKFSALDYILKPIDKEELIGAVAKLKPAKSDQQSQLSNLNDFLKGGTRKIALNLSDEIRLVELAKIIRIEADNNYCSFVLSQNETVLVSKHLGHFYEILKHQGFARVHQSHLINQQYLEKYVKRDGGYLVLTNGDQVPVSRTQKEHVLKLFADF